MEDNALQLHATETRSLIPSKIARPPELYIVACLLVLRTSILLKTSGALTEFESGNDQQSDREIAFTLQQVIKKSGEVTK